MGLFAAFAARGDGEGPWSVEPSLGVSAEHTTNPRLANTDVHAETREALLIDVPLRYDADELELLLRPNARVTDKTGYSALGSNYEHLDGAALFNDERDTASLQTEVARDSSLYYLGGVVDQAGFARDTASVSGDWTRSVTERDQLSLDSSWQRVRYDQPASANLLVDYRYLSAGPTLAYALSERNTLKLLGTYGDYESLSGTTKSTSENLQVGFVRLLSEAWTLSTSAGYSRSVNTEHTEIDYFGYLFPVTQKASQSGTVYTASVTRQGERLSFSGSVSRALQPTGFAFLSRQDSYNASATYVRSERWDFGFSAGLLKAINPQVASGGVALNTQDVANHYLNVRLAANWHWTPQWSISLTVNEISQQYAPPPVSVDSVGVNIDVVRKFLRSQF